MHACPLARARRAATPWWGLAALLLAAAAAQAADEGGSGGGEALPNAASAFGKLVSWQGRDADTRTPRIFSPVDNLPPRALAPPMQQRGGWQPRLGAALEWTSNPRFASGGSPAASAWALLAGLQYGLQAARVSLGFDASLEAIDSRSADLRVDTLDAATLSAYARGSASERLAWEATTLLQRSHEPDGGLVLDADQRRFRTGLQRHRLALAWRLSPTLDLFSRAETVRRGSHDPVAVDSTDTTLAAGLVWRRSALQRWSASLHGRQVDFEQRPDTHARLLQLQWEQQWSATWLSDLALSAANLQGPGHPLLWRIGVVHSAARGNLACSAERSLDAAGNLGRLLDVLHARCDADWRLGRQGRLSLGLESARYRLGQGDGSLHSLRPRLTLLWPLDTANWLQLRASATDDRLRDQPGQRRDLRLQATFIHTFRLEP